jgi:hypothetical protein
MLDKDLAELYQVPTKRLNEQVKRNVNRFPLDFMFQLSEEEAAALRSHSATSKTGRGGRRYLPYAFTEHGDLCGVRSPRYLRASQGIGRCAPQPLASPACASARNIDAGGPRIENKLERACGTNGRSVIWPSNSRAQRPGTLVPHDGQQPFEVRW